MIDIKQSKNDLAVPVIEGVHLHSVYNPTKEAQTFADKNEHVLEGKNKVLILGLGFAYHVDALLERFNNVNISEEKEFIVLEPSIELFEECQKRKLLPNAKNIQYICGVDIQDLYSNYPFVNFLLDNPGVIAHPASFSLNKKYFTKFLDFKASNYLEDITELSSDAQIREYLSNANLTKWNELVHDANNTIAIENPADFLVMALKGFDQNTAGEMNE